MAITTQFSGCKEKEGGTCNYAEIKAQGTVLSIKEVTPKANKEFPGAMVVQVGDFTPKSGTAEVLYAKAQMKELVDSHLAHDWQRSKECLHVYGPKIGDKIMCSVWIGGEPCPSHPTGFEKGKNCKNVTLNAAKNKRGPQRKQAWNAYRFSKGCAKKREMSLRYG